ncbi:MAG: hypothetical protein K8W52_40005 [Deltaproteobacteria bacterium]|nr:hypothetical protein [Deltaproteobacteria bacterium]
MSLDLRRHAVRWAPVAACAAVLIWHSLQYNFVTDDAYISFVYSRNLAEHGQLTFNLDHPVEGYTNFLWTFILGVLMLLGIPPEWSSRVLGTACGIGVLVVAFRLTERLLGKPHPKTWGELSGWPYLPPLLLAWSSGFACWSSGGLETQLFTLCVALAIEAYVASEDGEPMKLVRAAIYLALAAMTRPEGLLIAAILGAHRVGLNLALRRRLIPDVAERRAILGFLAVWAPWFAWRYWYYGYPFPNTYYVKATGQLVGGLDKEGHTMAEQVWLGGFYYLKRWALQINLAWISPALLVGLIARPRTPRFVFASLALPLTLIYLVYTASVGGDFMGLHRFIMPIFVLVAITASLGLATLADLAIARRVPRLVPAAIVAMIVAAFAWSQWRLTSESLRWGNFDNDHGIDTPAFLIVYTEDRATIGKAMEPCFKDGDFSIVGGAGAQPYYGRMQAIDLFGLVSDRIAHEEPRVNARAGHTKRASDAMLSSYDPTFVFHCYELTPDPDHHREFDGCSGYWKAHGYEPVTMHIPGLLQKGEYYTFLAKKDRHFECPGRVR